MSVPLLYPEIDSPNHFYTPVRLDCGPFQLLLRHAVPVSPVKAHGISAAIVLSNSTEVRKIPPYFSRCTLRFEELTQARSQEMPGHDVIDAAFERVPPESRRTGRSYLVGNIPFALVGGVADCQIQ